MNKKHMVIFVGILAGVIITVIVVSLVLINTRSSSDDTADTLVEIGNDGAGPEIDLPVAYFNNRYQLTLAAGKNQSATTLDLLQNLVLDSEEIATAPNPIEGGGSNTGTRYTATIVEDSFTELPDQPNDVYRFFLEISDGRKYLIYAYIDSSLVGNDGTDDARVSLECKFVAVASRRIDLNEATPRLQITYATTDHSMEAQVNTWYQTLSFDAS